MKKWNKNRIQGANKKDLGKLEIQVKENEKQERK